MRNRQSRRSRGREPALSFAVFGALVTAGTPVPGPPHRSGLAGRREKREQLRPSLFPSSPWTTWVSRLLFDLCTSMLPPNFPSPSPSPSRSPDVVRFPTARGWARAAGSVQAEEPATRELRRRWWTIRPAQLEVRCAGFGVGPGGGGAALETRMAVRRRAASLHARPGRSRNSSSAFRQVSAAAAETTGVDRRDPTPAACHAALVICAAHRLGGAKRTGTRPLALSELVRRDGVATLLFTGESDDPSSLDTRSLLHVAAEDTLSCRGSRGDTHLCVGARGYEGDGSTGDDCHDDGAK